MISGNSTVCLTVVKTFKTNGTQLMRLCYCEIQGKLPETRLMVWENLKNIATSNF